MERKIIFSTDEFYHIYNRGTEKRKIFQDISDYQRFLKLLYLLNNTEAVDVREVSEGLPFGEVFNLPRGDQLIDVGAYCPMPNHFHLLVREKTGKGVSAFMLKLLTGYSMYFNKKYDRTGQLFEGTFKAKHLDDDNYLKYNFAYSHLNPIKLIDSDWKEKGISDLATAKEFLANYKYSSYLDYLGVDRPEGRILNKEAFPEYFQNPKEFEDFIDDWLNYQDLEEFPKGYPSGTGNLSGK